MIRECPTPVGITGRRVRPTVAPATSPYGLLVPVNKRTWWGAIVAGAFVGFAVHACLSILGVAIGLAVYTPFWISTALYWWGAAIWLVGSALVALFAGGWTAGRLSGSRQRADGALHGLIAWCLTTAGWVAMAVFAFGLRLALMTLMWGPWGMMGMGMGYGGMGMMGYGYGGFMPPAMLGPSYNMTPSGSPPMGQTPGVAPPATAAPETAPPATAAPGPAAPGPAAPGPAAQDAAGGAG